MNENASQELASERKGGSQKPGLPVWVRLLGGVLGALAVASFVGIVVFDVDLDGDTFVMSIVNDTEATVYVSGCRDSTCRRVTQAKLLQAGAEYSHNAVASSSIVDAKIVLDGEGGVIGCLMLGPYASAEPGKKAYVSDAEPCPVGYATPEVH